MATMSEGIKNSVANGRGSVENMLAEVLEKFEPLGTDEYFYAFGTGDCKFIGTPTGYTANSIPKTLIDTLLGTKIKKIRWVSFGDRPESWFMAYDLHDGEKGFQTGNAIPCVLAAFLDQLSKEATVSAAKSICVQLGNNESYVAWTHKGWISSLNIPQALSNELTQRSIHCRELSDCLIGVSNSFGPLSYMSWHSNESYYFKTGSSHRWYFQHSALRQGWSDFWYEQSDDTLTAKELDNLAHVVINPHSIDGDCFVFIKKGRLNSKADVVARFDPAIGTEKRLPPTDEPLSTRPANLQLQAAPPQKPDGPQQHLWGTSKRKGRPHRNDTDELELKMGEKVKIIKDMGKNWLVAENKKGNKGFVHKTWVDLAHFSFHADPKDAYAKYCEDTVKLFRPLAAQSFLNLTDYMDTCTREGCRQLKDDSDSLGVCAHDLHELMLGSDRYSVAFLKQERNMFHPDRFARFCDPEHREVLKAKAEQLFMLFGVLIDWAETAM